MFELIFNHTIREYKGFESSDLSSNVLSFNHDTRYYCMHGGGIVIFLILEADVSKVDQITELHNKKTK